MNKSDKKIILKKLIEEFFCETEPIVLTRLRDKIYGEICHLPMSSNDKYNLEEEMYLWNYKSDQYIQNIKSNSLRTNVAADFEAMLQKVDISLLGN